MLSQEVQEKLTERLVSRIEETNTYILEKIGNTIKEIGSLTPTQAQQLAQILKYGGTYYDIARQIAKVSGKNVQDIYKIFEEVAKKNKQFARQFYEFRNIPYIPYSQDIALQNQVKSIARITAETYLNISRTEGIGFLFRDLDGQMYFKDIQQAYSDIVDRAVLSIIQGKETYQSEMRRIIKDIGNSGVVLYESGRTRRLDSALRMNILDGMRQVSNQTAKIYAEQYGADGVEISVHTNPAPDHEDIQGRQFTSEQFDILENGGEAEDIKGNVYNGAEKRQISEYNCHHYIFPIVVGVSQPEYTDEQLEEIKKKNQEGFVYEGKHYTMYEGTQLQRKIETEIRRQKETNILAKASGDEELAMQARKKARLLRNKYNELCNVSGLKPKKGRMRVVS